MSRGRQVPAIEKPWYDISAIRSIEFFQMDGLVIWLDVSGQYTVMDAETNPYRIQGCVIASRDGNLFRPAPLVPELDNHITSVIYSVPNSSLALGGLSLILPVEGLQDANIRITRKRYANIESRQAEKVRQLYRRYGNI